MAITYHAGRRIQGTSTSTDEYKVHSFTGDGTFEITAGSGSVDYLMVAGGGGGGGSKTGNSGGGGGGAGGMLQNTASLSSNTYSITVGQGGTGGIGGYGTGNGGCTGDDGTDSTFNSLTAIGGGGGAGGSGQGGTCAHARGNDGGSGGGEGTYGQYGTTSSPYYGTGTSGQGNNGGAHVPYGTGGGGGAGSVGGDGSSTTSGSGGNGLSSSITGTATFYAGGGGGAGYNTNGGTGGSSIGGDGGANGGTSTAYGGGNGVTNTGSGGGGASICTGWACSGGAVGGSGSDGIVIVRYVNDGSITATGGTITTIDVTSTVTKPTNVQAGSRFEETDTRKMYHYNAPTLSFEDDFDTDSGWTTAGTSVIDTTNEYWRQLDRTPMYKSLGVSLDTTWVCDLDIYWTGIGTSGWQGYVMFTNYGATAYNSSTGTPQYIGLRQRTDGKETLRITNYDGGETNATDVFMATGASANTWYFYRVIRNGNDATLTRYTSDANRTSDTGGVSITSTGFVAQVSWNESVKIQYIDGTGYSSDQEYRIKNVKIYNGATSPDTVWSEGGT